MSIRWWYFKPWCQHSETFNNFLDAIIYKPYDKGHFLVFMWLVERFKRTVVIFFLQEEIKEAHDKIVNLERLKVFSNTYILKRKITSRKC